MICRFYIWEWTKLYRCPIRGGNWNNGTNAGLFYLNLNNPRSNVNWNIGGRCALHLLARYVRRDTTPDKRATIYGLRSVAWV